jgi:serine O-acetyltransferase
LQHEDHTRRHVIRSRTDFAAYLEADRISLGRSGRPPLLLIQDPIWYYQRLLRRVEFLCNCRPGAMHWPLRMWARVRLRRASLLLGFHIPLNTIGPGLRLVHEGDVLIHQSARIGRNARINIGVVIGRGAAEGAFPAIGDDVVIEPGAKIFGDIRIPDGTHIGANAVVNRSIDSPGMIVAGVPARVIKPNAAWSPARR